MEQIKQWITDEGYLAVVKLQTINGIDSHYCGYIGVPNSHPIANDECPHCGHDKETIYSLDVHGGVTFARFDDKYPVENKGLYWVGYDCQHSYDLTWSQIESGSPFDKNATFKDMKYCIAQCEKLSKQLAELAE